MPSLGPRPKTNPGVNRFQYHVRVILEAIYAPDEVWGRSRLVNAHHVRVILEVIYAPDEVWGRSRLVNAHHERALSYTSFISTF